MYALVDANSFYASAEKVFDPSIRERPVVVLTNNDGCICALCEHAKHIGVQKFGPYYKVKGLLAQHNAVIRSSNYELYDDLSSRMMQIIGRYAPHQHVYSIDECFLYFDNWHPNVGWGAYARDIQATVLKQLRLPIGVGMGSTPTLAKVASFAGKRLGTRNGIAVLKSPRIVQKVLERMQVSDVWGIGRRISARLNEGGIQTAWQLACANPKSIRKQFSVEIERTVRELNGTTCIQWDAERPNKKQIYATRAFGTRVTHIGDLRQALCWHAERVAEKLRRQQSSALTLTLFAHANPFATEGHYHKAVQHKFGLPTSDTRELVRVATKAAEDLYRPGVLFHKCGVGAIEIIDNEYVQPDMFAEATSNPKLMACIDAINSRYGSHTVGVAAKGIQKGWGMKRDFLSPQYTTNWAHIPKITCN